MLTILAFLLLFLSAWIVMPAPSVWLLPLAVGAPEVSPFLLAASGLVVLLALRKAGSRKLAIVVALAAAGFSALPYSDLARVQREFDRELARAFPASAQRAAPADARPEPFVALDLVRGLDTSPELQIVRAAQFASHDGVNLVLDIYRPTGTGPFPVMVQVYGGAWQGGTRTDNETFARYFASRGYMVYATEYRHAPRWPWPAALEDTRAAIAWARSHAKGFGGDPSRMIVFGRSAGAQLAMVAAYSGNINVAAVINYYGPTDLARGWEEVPSPDPIGVRSVLEAFLKGTPAAEPQRYRDASPMTYAAAGAPPTLHIYGTRDNVVLPVFGRDLHKRLVAGGARSVYLEIPWAGHAFDTLPSGLSAQVALYYTERFLASVLPRRRGA